ncbi:MAG: glycosyltransferase [Phycisphaerales bacterium JB064]
MPAVMILADEDFASRERDMLARLEVGLVSEGLRVLHAVPDTLPELLDGRVFSQAIGYVPHGPLPPLARRARALAQRALESAGSEGIALVHVFGGNAWRLGFETAGLLGANLVLEVFSAQLADALGSAHLDSVDDRVIASIPGTGLERRCLRKLDSRHLRLIRWGVHAEGEPAKDRRLGGGDRPAVLMAGTGQDANAWTHALESLSRVRLDGDQPPLIFADAEAAHKAHLRKAVERFALAEHVSFVPVVEARRDPVLEVDALLLPDALHEHRSLVLDAHANGILVAAVADPVIDELTADYGVTQLDPGDPDRWTEELRRVFEDKRLADERRLAGWTAVERFHTGTAHVAAVQSLYEGLLAQKSG